MKLRNQSCQLILGHYTLSRFITKAWDFFPKVADIFPQPWNFCPLGWNLCHLIPLTTKLPQLT